MEVMGSAWTCWSISIEMKMVPLLLSWTTAVKFKYLTLMDPEKPDRLLKHCGCIRFILFRIQTSFIHLRPVDKLQASQSRQSSLNFFPPHIELAWFFGYPLSRWIWIYQNNGHGWYGKIFLYFISSAAIEAPLLHNL